MNMTRQVTIELSERDERLLKICGGNPQQALTHGLQLYAEAYTGAKLDDAKKEFSEIHDVYGI